MKLVWLSVAFAMLAQACGSSRDKQLIGAWVRMQESRFEFRADGTFDHESRNRSIWGDSNVVLFEKGTWRTSGGKIFLRTKSVSESGIKRAQAHFNEHRRYMLENEVAMPYKWVNKDEWWPSELAAGHYHRVLPL